MGVAAGKNALHRPRVTAGTRHAHRETQIPTCSALLNPCPCVPGLSPVGRNLARQVAAGAHTSVNVAGQASSLLKMQRGQVCTQVPCRRVLETARAVKATDEQRGIPTEDLVVRRLAKAAPQHSDSWTANPVQYVFVQGPRYM